jgi:hypothetical protein
MERSWEIRSFERAALRLDPQRLHDEVEYVWTMEVEEIKMDAFFTLSICNCAFAFVSGVTNVRSRRRTCPG